MTFFCSILNIEPYINENTEWELYLEDIEEYPLIKKLSKDMVDILGEKVSGEYRRVIKKMDTEVIRNIFSARNLLAEQLEYLDEKIENKCHVYFIYANVDNSPYGGIFAFWNEDRKDVLFIQAITKYFHHTMMSLFDAEESAKFPKLNTVLSAPIESLANRLGAKKIQVAPIGKQGSILEKHYGYTKMKAKKLYYPCKMIKGENFAMQGYTEVYVKHL